MREHQIVITLKPEQFLEVQRLARAAGAKSMGMFVRQKLLSVLGIEGAGPEPTNGSTGVSPVAAANAAKVANELRRLHGELKMFVAESLAKPYVEEPLNTPHVEEELESVQEIDALLPDLLDDEESSLSGEYLDENPFFGEPSEPSRSEQPDIVLRPVSTPEPATLAAPVPEPEETTLAPAAAQTAVATMAYSTFDSMPNIPDQPPLWDVPEAPFIESEPEFALTKLTEALTGWGELVSDLPGGGWITTPPGEMRMPEATTLTASPPDAPAVLETSSLSPDTEAALEEEPEDPRFVGLKPKLPDFPPEPGSVPPEPEPEPSSMEDALSGHGIDPEMTTDELKDQLGSLPEVGLSRAELKNSGTAVRSEAGPATLEEALRDFDTNQQDDLEQIAKKAFAISPRLGALQPGAISDLSRPVNPLHSDPDPLADLLDDPGSQQPSQTLSNAFDEMGDEDDEFFDEDEIFDVPLSLEDQKPRAPMPPPMPEIPVPQLPEPPAPPSFGSPQQAPPPPPPPPPPRPSTGPTNFPLSGGPPPRKR
jgi:hypothetical protein